MIVRRFLLWARTASASERAEGVRFLAQAWRMSQLSPEEKRDAETAMLAMLDDPSALVRKALAETIAGEPAPRALVLGLSHDQPDIAALILNASPVLTDADLVDAVAVGDTLAQTAVARRLVVSTALAAALIEVGQPEAVAALLANPGAALALPSLLRAVERFADHADVRGALMEREGLPLAVRHRLATHTAGALSGWAASAGLVSRDRMERLARESTERVAIRLAADHAAGGANERELKGLLDELRVGNRLTPALVLRSLLSGETMLAEAALADLAGLPLARAASLIHDRRGSGVEALCRKAGIPAPLIPAFAAAAAALAEIGAPTSEQMRARTARRITERVLIACESGKAAADDELIALLRRFEAEAAREEARELADSFADDAALQVLLEVDPELTLLEAEPDHTAIAA